MSRDERLQVIRQSKTFRAQLGKIVTYRAPGVAIAGSPGATCHVTVQVKTILMPQEPRKKTSFCWNDCEPNTNRAPRWWREPTPKPKPFARVKRIAGKSALTKTAEQTPAET